MPYKNLLMKLSIAWSFDGEKLSDLLEPLELGWKERTTKELELMEDLIPLLKKLAGGREIAGLGAYE